MAVDLRARLPLSWRDPRVPVSTGPGKDVPAPHPANLSADSPERLLTSEDLFGDLVDEPIRAEAPRALDSGASDADPRAGERSG